VLVVYLDASALAKRYSPETGSELLDDLFEQLPIQQITCTTIGLLEVLSILIRKRNDGRLSKLLFDQAIREFEAELLANASFARTPLNDPLILSAAVLIRKHNINASDAVILQSALNLHEALSTQQHQVLFWCSDRRLGRAAKSEGIDVFDPEHDSLEQFSAFLTNR